ncbi:MAG: N-6 DNA methylase [Nitrospirae bacterium]|nr:N-6 DNA methylase [Nitrospirota bacterium]
MDKQQAQDIVRNTFENPFDKGRFGLFLKDLFNHIEETPSTVYRGNLIPDAYKPYVSTLDRIGKYQDGDGNKIDLLVVHLKKETSLERARTMQRNFIAWYLNGSRGGVLKDAALAAFVSPNEEDWRFSLVKMDYRFEEGKSGKVKIKEEFTPARRWSFLVGKNENSHTAQSRLVPILADDKNNPTLAGLEEAFNIERVTKEFFEKYRDLFLRTKEMLDEVVAGDVNIKADFEAKDVNTVDFAKKLLGQIVFLYFLQKKGWFGVKRDAEWGTGTKHFLRELFDGRHGAYNNFFNDILEPLFYEALRIDRGHDDGYYSRFNCKIPFLNGGLFDPINNYDWVHTDIILPNELFSNALKTKEGDKGNGILDIFDRYNFTVKEDEPLEKEVAVDPEMLGKVFENLLEVKDRKSKGTYYTPREIVHYMCRQSLINYLATEVGAHCTTPLLSECHSRSPLSGNPVPSKEDLETLIKYGEQVGENEATVIAKGRETGTYYHKLPESIRQNAALIDEKLANIKVCDPAIGSGAFPVGMMSEIVKTRMVLNSYLCHSREGGNPVCKNRSTYNFKRECIEKSLYGVDIDPGAVEIAKLRLWLSLMVDEEDIKQIKPLPNLDYKIVCGNSLLGVEKNLFNEPEFKELERIKPLLFNETSPKKKQEYKNQIDDLISKITNGHTEFDFEVYFSEVFHEKKGFDVVIANPPYIQIQSFSGRPEQDAWKRQNYATYVKTGDVYCMFYEQGFSLLSPKGVLTFITSNKWMRANYGKAMRKFFMGHGRIDQLIDFGDSQLFENATTYTNILVWRKDDISKEIHAWDLSKAYDADVSLEELLVREGTCSPLFSLDSFVIAKDDQFRIRKKIEVVGVPLKDWDIAINYGIKTGMNEAFIINGKKKDELIAVDPNSAEIIKPILRGRDIKKYRADFAELWMIATFPALQIKIDSYPAIRDYLKSFGKQLEQTGKPGCRKKTSNKWFEVQDTIAYHAEFEKEKIVYAEIVYDSAFYYDTKGYYPEATSFLITGERLKYLTALLNSKLLTYAFRTFYAGGDLRGNTFRYKKVFLENLPIPKIDLAAQRPFEILVDQILAAKKKHTPQSPLDRGEVKNADTSALEKQIDEMVYALYGLMPEEIAIVEGKK